jgi:aspartate carbamoyltransferase catalytic subunit
MFQQKHLLDLESLEADEIIEVLDTAESFRQVLERPIPKVPVLRAKTVANLFFEPSTRTRISFELAEKRLSADVVNFSASGSSVQKGETLRDTADNILAMKVDMIVMRHPDSGAARYLAQRVGASVINAGDGMHAHPTQALLDMLTMRQKLGDLSGKKITIVGDIAHSRVARSNIWGLTKLGAEVTVCGPAPMIPLDIESLGCGVQSDLGRAIADADAVNVLRIQLERQKNQIFPGNREYARAFRLDREMIRKTREHCIIMHPGPMNRDVEISTEVADGDRQVILEQVTNGVAVRMAVLYLVSGGVREKLGESLG